MADPKLNVDELFAAPYTDMDEWRDAPVRHRYVHGGFTGTETRFSIYLPPAEQYASRFFQHITPVPDSEHLAQWTSGEQDKISFAVDSGAYFVETNGGGTVATGAPGSAVDPTISAYRANAAAAQYSRVVAADMYGEHRPFGYAYGGSGGGYRTIGGAENTSGVWDGFVPYVIGSPMAIPNMFTVRMHAQRVLRHKFDDIVDAVEPWGSGDMYSTLNDEERDVLREVTRMGFPPRSWFGHRTMGMHAFPVLYVGLTMADPSYFDDFWTTPGYLGYEPPPSLAQDQVQHSTQIAATISASEAEALGLDVGRQPGQSRGGVDTAWQGAGEAAAIPVAVRLATTADREVAQGADLVVTSGAAAGQRLGLVSVHGDIAIFGPGDAEAMSGLAAGDDVTVDNTWFLAAQTYHRHQVPTTDDYPVWDQFRAADGAALYPQRDLILGPLFAAAASGTVQTGEFDGKMIVVASLLDREALPWQADWYYRKVREHFGDATDERFRLWFTDNALHGDDEAQEWPTHSVSYIGELHQALRDVSAWVEKGVAPPRSTQYTVNDGQITAPAAAVDRAGVQPVVSLSVDGGVSTDVGVGEPVTFHVEADAPPGAGSIVAVQWDAAGAGDFADSDPVAGSGHVVVERQFSFDASGTYFPTVRVAAHRDGDGSSPFARLQNLARVRVVVR